MNRATRTAIDGGGAGRSTTAVLDSLIATPPRYARTATARSRYSEHHFRWYVDLWASADSRAFEGIFFSEHHFGAAYSPSPNLLISHVAARTSRLRLGVLGSVTPYTTPWRLVEEIGEVFDSYRQGADEAGHPHGPDQIAVRRMVTLVERPSQQREAVNRAKRALLGVLQASAGSLPPWAALLDRPDESIAALSDEEFVSGTPQQVAEQLIEQCQVIGARHLLVAFSERDYDRLEESHELFSSEVAPLLLEATVV